MLSSSGKRVGEKNSMRRARIRLQIAKAISQILPLGHKLSYANVRRYLTRDLLTQYNIRRDTSIHSSDWLIAIQVAREERVARMRDGIAPGVLPSEDRLREIFWGMSLE
jgi:hypothetical protein